MINAVDFTSSLAVCLPAITPRRADTYCELLVVLEPGTEAIAESVIVMQRGTTVQRARLSLDSRSYGVCFTKAYVDSGEVRDIHAPNACVAEGRLIFGKEAVWKKHDRLEEPFTVGYTQQVVESWEGYPILKRERLDNAQGILSPGLRAPQVGALHALAAHWSVKNTHAKIVLPTGTGKTDVMVAATLIKQPRRTLVVVPSDALRTQVLKKFVELGILKDVGVVPRETLAPVVARILKAPREINDFSILRKANVVVSTTQMLLGMDDELIKEFLCLFDLIFFDEAHHLPAASWQRIQSKVPREAAVVSATATPYRNDGKRVPGEVVYQFPLRLAQEQGYFRRIGVARVEEYDSTLADRAIALRAIETLRTDEAEGFRHIIFARAKSIDHATVLQEIYAEFASDLNPSALHSRVPARLRKEIVSALRSVTCRVVVCVDMLGEGFDLPSLKIAALHDVHKTLPVTLQFIGRFTRSAQNVGAATAVINLAEPMAQSAVAELFADDADWNELIPELSAQAVRSEEDIVAFLRSMRSADPPEDRKFDIGLIRPSTSVTMYRASRFNPERLKQGLPRSTVIHQTWLNDDRNLLVFVSQDRVFPDWSASKEAASFEWNLGVIAFDEEARLLYVNSTYRGVTLSKMARAVAGESASLVNGERVFRVFENVRRAVLGNVGLYRRGGGLRFQMLMGLDVGEYVTNAVQAGSSKSNLLAFGYEEGRKISIGASAKGRVWSMGPSSIPDWLAWAKRLAGKIMDDDIQTNSFLRFALIPTEVSTKPDIPVFACVPPEELLPGDFHGERKIVVPGMSTSFSQLDLSLEVKEVSAESVDIELAIDETKGLIRLRWEGGFRADQIEGASLLIMEAGQQIRMNEFLTMHPPALLLVDGSELVGKQHFKFPETHPYTFHANSILAIQWGDVPIKKESKWSRGQQRVSSVQGFMIDKCLERDSDFVFDDDDSGEAADIIVIDDRRENRELEVSLYHCKFSDGVTAGARVNDLYEVCGQAVKSARMMNRVEGLLAHMAARESRLGGRPTRFERGTIGDLRSLQRRANQYRMRLNIYVVQPGLSAQALNPELSSILSAADGFILEFTGRRLKVLASD